MQPTITLFLDLTPNCKGTNAKLTTAAGRLVANVTRKTPETAESVATAQAKRMLEGFTVIVKRRTVKLAALNGSNS